MASIMHIRGVQPSKANKRVRQHTPTVSPLVSGLHKNIQKIISTKKKTNSYSPSFGVNNMFDLKAFNFFMDCCSNNNQLHLIPINTIECNNFLTKYNIEFINERTQEISNSKALITTKTNRKKNAATFVLQLPIDYTDILVLLLLIKIDFGNIQIEFSPNVGRNLKKFIQKAKQSGFKLYYDFIRLNVLNKRLLSIR